MTDLAPAADWAEVDPPEGSGLHPENTSFTVLGRCHDCVHRYDYEPGTQLDLCDAYPSAPGIPAAILSDPNGHASPYGGEALDESGEPIIFEEHLPVAQDDPGPDWEYPVETDENEETVTL